MRLRLGDKIRLKKTHPCGSDLWEILRTGADIRIRCLGCGRMLLLPRIKIEKDIKDILVDDDPPLDPTQI